MTENTAFQLDKEWSVVRDGAGREFRVLKIGKLHQSEVLLKAFVPEQDFFARRERVLNMGVHEDDVVLLTFPKSGTHWLWEILTMLISGKPEYVPWIPERDFLDKQGDKIEQNPSTKVILTHYSIHDLPKEVFQKKTKIVHVSRNPKSVAVSMFHHFKTGRVYGDCFPETFTEFLPLFIDEENHLGHYWFHYIQEVETFCRENPGYPIINIKYEELKKNQYKEIKRLADFLGIKASDSLVEDIISKCEISKLRDVRDKDIGRPYMYRKGACIRR